jgi:hypothetical protein
MEPLSIGKMAELVVHRPGIWKLFLLRNHVLTVATEQNHPASIEKCKPRLERGASTTRSCPVEGSGVPRPA